MKIPYKSLIMLCLFFISTSTLAHQSALSYLELKEQNDLTVEVTLKKPSQDIDSDDLKVEFPRTCEDILPPTSHQDEEFIISKRELWCSDKGLEGSSIWVNDLLENDKGVIFRYVSRDGKRSDKLLTAADPHVLIELSDDTQDSMSAYFWLGVEHILLGIDHLLFVLALLLLVSDIRLLIKTITAFTVAHSITLGLATMGYVEFSVSYIEAMIALSILFLARELLRERASSLTYRFPWLIAFGFGLLHGLGFASALSDVGLPSDDIALSLLFFNLGVELGQLIFILAVLLLIRITYSSLQRHKDPIRTSMVYLIGITAAYWFIERSLSMF